MEHSFQQKINLALKWNSILFAANKVAYLGTSALLYRTLTSESFTEWAYINSLIFLILLWTDCGLRKSIPCYIESINAHRSFLTQVLWLQIGVGVAGSAVLGATLWFYGVTPILATLGVIVYLLWVPISALRLFYHSNFRHKEFNALHSKLLLAEFAILLIGSLVLGGLSLITLYYLCSAFSLSILCWTMLRQLHLADSHPTSPADKPSTRDFFIHTSVMWGTTVAKSTTQRNVILPLLTGAVGVEAASIYKLANDWALTLQRAITKTIDTTDTSYLAAMNHGGEEQVVAGTAHITQRLWGLAPALFGIVALASALGYWVVGIASTTISLFALLATSYLIEVLLSPYERLIEVRAAYKKLWYTHLPYACFVLGLVFLPAHFRTLYAIILFSTSVRLVSALTTLLIALRTYTFPRAHHSGTEAHIKAEKLSSVVMKPIRPFRLRQGFRLRRGYDGLDAGQPPPYSQPDKPSHSRRQR